MFKDLANLGNLMRQAQQSLGRADEIKEKLRNERVSANAGGGMVEVEMNGVGDVEPPHRTGPSC